MAGTRKASIIALVSALVTAAAPAAALAAPKPVADGHGNWSVGCQFTHRAPDDPIVFPREPGRSHMHDFFSNPSTNAFTTRRRLIAAEDRCSRPADGSAYWAPTLTRGEMVDENGAPTGITPLGATIYYLAAGRDPATIRPFPKGLRMIAGDAGARGGQDPRRVSWFCHDRSTGTRTRPAPEPPLCLGNQRTMARILFPDCANGKRDGLGHSGHVAYSTRERGAEYRTCPAKHPIPIPQVRLTIVYPDGVGLGSHLDSGGRLSLHADFFEAWRGRSVERLIASCLAKDLACGARPNGFANPRS